MYRAVVNYTDFNNEEISEPIYFNLSSREALKLMKTFDTNDLQQYLIDLAGKGNVKDMIPVIEEFILSSYGERSSDGKRFDKSDQIRANFENSIAYAEYFETLFTDPSELQRFVDNTVRVSNASSVKNQNGGKVEIEVVETNKTQMTPNELLSAIKENPELAESILKGGNSSYAGN